MAQTISSITNPDGPSGGQKFMGFLGWFIFIPLSIGICIGFEHFYPQFMPLQDVPPLVEVPEIKIDEPKNNPAKNIEVSDTEKARIAMENGYLHVALEIYKKLIETATFQKRFEYVDKAEEIKQKIADQRNYLAAVKLFEDANYYAARASLDDIFDVGEHGEEIKELNRKVDLALSVDDAMIEYVNGNLEKVIDILAINDADEAMKLVQKVTEIIDLFEMAELKMDQMDFMPAKAAYEEIMSKVKDKFHPTYAKAETKFKELSDNKKLAEILIAKGDKNLNDRNFKEVRQFYIKASEYDTEEGNKKIEYFDGLAKLLYKQAGVNQKTRPMMAYYALKDAFELAEEGSSLQKQIKSKMVSISGMLKRYKVEVE
jgi:hypothetical protein